MPHVRVSYRAAQPSDIAELSQKLTTATCEVYTKPPAVVFVEATANDNLMFAGSQDPCAVVQLDGIGDFAEEVHESFAARAIEALKPFGIDGSRVFVKFIAFQPDMWTLNGESIKKKRAKAAAAAAAAAEQK